MAGCLCLDSPIFPFSWVNQVIPPLSVESRKSLEFACFYCFTPSTSWPPAIDNARQEKAALRVSDYKRVSVRAVFMIYVVDA
jgi:hypothetical protein